MTPERIAINVKDGEPDNNGNKPVDEQFKRKGKRDICLHCQFEQW